MVVCVGYRERDGDRCFNTAVCVHGDGVLGTHRKVHQPAGEPEAYAPGDGFTAFDTPVGRLGMLIDYDKTFPEAARSLALDGAQILACLSAWPTSVTATRDVHRCRGVRRGPCGAGRGAGSRPEPARPAAPRSGAHARPAVHVGRGRGAPPGALPLASAPVTRTPPSGASLHHEGDGTYFWLLCRFCGRLRRCRAACGAVPPRSRAPSASLRDGASATLDLRASTAPPGSVAGRPEACPPQRQGDAQSRLPRSGHCSSGRGVIVLG
ncbi:MAG: nitrilase-related carbon-nitrogen hydrolase [Pseudonocardia sp.]